MWVSLETTNSGGGGRMVTRKGWGAEIGVGSSGWGCFKISRLYGIGAKTVRFDLHVNSGHVG
jgi:hypothetical protein